MTAELDARVLFDTPAGGTTLYLGTVASVACAGAALRSAMDEAAYRGGRNLRVEMRDRDGVLVYSANVREDVP